VTKGRVTELQVLCCSRAETPWLQYSCPYYGPTVVFRRSVLVLAAHFGARQPRAAVHGVSVTSISYPVYTPLNLLPGMCKPKVTPAQSCRRKALRLLYIDSGQSIAIDRARVLRD